jgi:hypothetical protein
LVRIPGAEAPRQIRVLRHMLRSLPAQIKVDMSRLPEICNLFVTMSA